MDENFSDDVCQCTFCEARYIIQLDKILIPVSQKAIDILWFGNPVFPIKNTKIELNKGDLFISYVKNDV